ncbi:pyruvate kinase [Maridesulfovibrio sp. FT414]|uniref:pyruvate kinase n=1 Tax=Maridesulfovibrio sp. FT414 TaxID=2979469 RepID=UPI003D80024E
MKKLLVTLGPSSLYPEMIRRIAKSDVYIFRLNLSHIAFDEIKTAVKMIRDNCDIPICLDSEGAQVRNQNMVGDQVFYHKGSVVKIHFSEVVGDSANISFKPNGIAKKFRIGDILHVDFDLVSFEIIGECEAGFTAVVLKSGLVKSRKAVSLNRELSMEAIQEGDRRAFELGMTLGIKHYALSFAGNGRDVEQVRSIVGNNSVVISKIESLSGLKNIVDIISASDELLIDRGDLSKSISLEKIPFLQRRIISMCRLHGKPIFVATNLLESMVESEVPTRAELNDIVSTILMGADGLVLAAETATGKYPDKVVEMASSMCKLCQRWTSNTSLTEILEM